MVFDQTSYNDSDNSIYSLVKNILSSVNSCFPVKIVQVNEKTIDVVPVYGLVDLKSQPIEPPRINNIKYLKGQSSSYGVNVKPKIGDEGIVIFCSRDISNLDANMPSSPRSFDLADAVYIGLIQSNSELKCYVDVGEKDINLMAPNQIKMSAKEINIHCENLNIKANVNITGSLIINNIDFSKHIHSTPSGNSGGPE